MSGADWRQAVLDATLAALQHTVGREEHMPLLKQLVENQVGPVTFSEIADALASVDVSDRGPTWREEWVELIETIRRAERATLSFQIVAARPAAGKTNAPS